MNRMTESNTTDKDINVLLVGTTGSGKSSTGNLILSAGGGGEKMLEFFDTSMSLAPMTRFNAKHSRSIDGRKVTVVDTPGANNHQDDAVKIQQEVEAAVKSAKDGYDAIIYVIPIFKGELSMNDEEVKIFHLVQNLLGEKLLDYTVLVFTHGSNYQRMLAKMREEQPSKDYPEITFEEFIERDEYSTNIYAIGPTVQKVNGRAVLFENTEKDSSKRMKMVTNLLEKIEEIVAASDGVTFNESMLPPEPYRHVPQPRAEAVVQEIQDRLMQPQQWKAKYVVSAIVCIITALVKFDLVIIVVALVVAVVFKDDIHHKINQWLNEQRH